MLDTIGDLNAMGYGRNDRIAAVLPNGPEMAVAFLSIAAGFSFAPLNPLLRENEFQAYLKEMGAKAVIVRSGDVSPAAAAAGSLDIPIIELTPDPGEAGLFRLTGAPRGAPAPGGLAGDDDVALVLYTSGTTSRPKLVPLTHRNICYSAECMKEALGLGPEDRCLNIMPLFYIHGLVGAVLSSMAAGGSVVCTSGLSEPGFTDWTRVFRPTWYTATPAIHRMALDIIAKSGQPAPAGMRLIRSAASPLSGPDMAEIERTFNAPVLEGYGMTEAYQITCNPLPPAARKPGSVGRATGTEIRVVDGADNMLPEGMPGEIIVRGPNVMKGYENDPDGRSATFLDGWLRTGDYGYLDGEGYLFITGRIKEMINRGGEKVSPYEVEGALLAHPAVAESVAFPIPEPALGEAVGAAVVLREGAGETAEGLREFASQRLAYFKVPAVIAIVDSIPKGATGKVQRLGMAQALGVSLPGNSSGEYQPPTTPIERQLADIWSEVLHLDRVGADDDFFSLGGSSLDAIRLFALIGERLNVQLSINDIFQAPTPRRLAARIEGDSGSWQPAILLRKGSMRPPLFCVNSVVGTLTDYRWMLDELTEDLEVYGLQTPWHDPALAPASIEELASYFVRAMKLIQPQGPYRLFGYCFGGAVAYEMARQLRDAGDSVGFLGFTDLVPPKLPYRLDRNSLRRLSGRASVIVSNLVRTTWDRRIRRLSSIPASLLEFSRDNFAGPRREVRPQGPGDDPSSVDWIAELPPTIRPVTMKNHLLFEKYTVRPYAGNVAVFLCYETRDSLIDTIYYTPSMGWEKFVGGRLDIRSIPGGHATMVQPPFAKELARAVEECLRRVDASDGGP